MTTAHPPTTAELQAAYQRAGLWRIGMAYTDAIAIGAVRKCLEMSALARRRRLNLPAQLRLI